MSSGYIFPYGITLREGGMVDTFPAVEISFLSKNGERLSLILLIDSGAVVSALPKTDALVLGIDLQQGVPTPISGVGGEMIAGWKHEISVRIGRRNSFMLPIVFLDNELSPRILGRAGVFDRFTVIFEESQHRSCMLWNNTEESRSVKNILDEIKPTREN